MTVELSVIIKAFYHVTFICYTAAFCGKYHILKNQNGAKLLVLISSVLSQVLPDVASNPGDTCWEMARKVPLVKLYESSKCAGRNKTQLKFRIGIDRFSHLMINLGLI